MFITESKLLNDDENNKINKIGISRQDMKIDFNEEIKSQKKHQIQTILEVKFSINEIKKN